MHSATRVLLGLVFAALLAEAQFASAQQDLTLLGSRPKPKPGGPNLLFLYVDDLSTDIEQPVVLTPNIDALASRGVQFSRAYAPHAVCSPSRVALLVGQRTNHTQAVFNSYAPPQFGINGVPYLPCLLKQSGYHTVRVGKVFHHNQPECWNESYGSFSDDPWISQPMTPPHAGGFNPKLYGGPFLNGPDGSLGKMSDTKATDMTLDLLDQARKRLDETGKPFAVFLGLRATHAPLIYPERFLGDYTQADVAPLPNDEFTSGWKDDVNEESYATPDFYDESWGSTEAERRVQALLAYYRCISYVDEQLGRVLQRLADLNLEGSTVVVLVSDHGYSFSTHDHVGKTTGFEQDARTPMIISVPKTPGTHGQIVTRPVEHVDLYPTITELLTLDTSSALDGASLVPLIKDPQAAHKPAFYTTDEDFAFNLTRYVVAEDAVTGDVWKLGAWENDDDIPQVNQLYNLTDDPGEYFNLYSTPGQVAKVTELRSFLLDVGLLGLSSRNYGTGLAGTLGVPGLTACESLITGGHAILEIGNSTGAFALGAVLIGFSGAYAGTTGISVQPIMSQLIMIPANGLSMMIDFPGAPLPGETPIGFQVWQDDPSAVGGVSVSRALAIYL